jgi:uncharacterized protein with von Willebrand factor type A (vWA) domain
MSERDLVEEDSAVPSACVAARLVEFARLARSNGFRVGVKESLDAQQIARRCGVTDAQGLRWGLRSLLCSDQDDWERFDELFDAYWNPGRLQARYQSLSGSPLAERTGGNGAARGWKGRAADADRPQAGETDGAGEDGARGGASQRETLAQTDFRLLADSGSMREAERLAERLAQRMRRRLVRRQRVQRQGRRVHVRRTVRNSLRYGGTPLQLAFRERSRRQPRLILITDVSRSMSLYSYVFLRFARGVVNAFRDADAFACHTRLIHITDALRQADLTRVRESLALISQGWSGGTRLGEALRRFTQDYGRRVNSRTLFIMVSDGLDTGEPELLAQQLAEIRRRCRKVVWLNPLLGRGGYEVKTGAMLAALPHLDVFAPAHNLHSLLALEPVFTSL